VLTLRERILVLFVTAPEGFSATASELAKKFGAGRNSVQAALYRLVSRNVLTRKGYSYKVGEALVDELGGSDA
jgi:DNA-binding IclR family transcriptional regulator